MSELLVLQNRKHSLMRMDLFFVKKAFLLLKLGNLAPSVIVAGTNGKGTTSGFLWRLLSLQNFSCGLFTSPHLFCVTERIQCNKKTVGEDDINYALTDIKKMIGCDFYESLSFFELIFLSSLVIFSNLKTDINIFEVGMGGRLDATNILDPICSAVVSVGLDHTQWLGNSIFEIAKEKLAVARKNCPLFIGDIELGYRDDVMRANRVVSSLLGYTSVFYKKDFGYLSDSNECYLAQLQKEFFPCPDFLGKYPVCLRKNFSLALAMFSWVLKSCFYKNYSDSAISSKLMDSCERFAGSNDSWPYTMLARSQEFRIKISNNKNCTMIVDVCHNLESIKSFKEHVLGELRFKKYKNIIGCVSIFSDKDIVSMMSQLKTFLKPIYFFETSNPRCFKNSKSSFRIFKSFNDLWECVSSRLEDNSCFVVCGSFSAVGEVLGYFKALDSKILFPKKFGDYSFYSSFS